MDDHPELLAIFKEFLEVCGYNVLTALDGRKGLAVLRTHGVDGVIVDYDMPGMKGDEVAREIKRLHPKLPVLMLSGYGSALPKSALTAVDRVVGKSTFPEKLLLEISTLLDKFESALPASKRPVQKIRHRKGFWKRKA